LESEEERGRKTFFITLKHHFNRRVHSQVHCKRPFFIIKTHLASPSHLIIIIINFDFIYPYFWGSKIIAQREGIVYFRP